MYFRLAFVAAFTLVVAVALVASAQLAPPLPSDTEPPCTGAACVGEESSDSADCDGDTTDWGRNDNATHATTSAPLSYTLVRVYDSCSTGNWWQENRGFIIVQYTPVATAFVGGYTVEEGSRSSTSYYVVANTPAGGVDARWSGSQSPVDSACAASIGAHALILRVWDTLPCPIPPPTIPEAGWGNLIP